MKYLLALLMVTGAIAACSSSDDDKPAGRKVGNGVNDVHQACMIRSTWNRSVEKCSLCMASVVNPDCGCEATKDFPALCLDQQTARKAVCKDDNLELCVLGCAQPDCDCVDKCYVGQDACKKASDARDGCVAEACAPFCAPDAAAQ